MLAGAQIRYVCIAAIDPADGEVKYFLSQVLCFGAAGAVVDYNLLSRTITCIARRALGIPTISFFDDYLLMGRKTDLGAMREHMLEFLGDMVLGTRFRLTKTAIGSDVKYLGLFLSVGQTTVRISLGLERRTEVCAAIKLCLENGQLAREDAEVLCGKLNFCTQAWTGRAGRAQLSALYRRAYAAGRHSFLDNRLIRALGFFLGALEKEETYNRVMSRDAGQRRVVMLTDSTLEIVASVQNELEKTPTGWSEKKTFAFGPVETPGANDVNVYETEAVLRGLKTLPDAKAEISTFIHIYIDNSCCQGSLIKGHSRSGKACDLVDAIWNLLLEKGWLAFFDRVDTKRNIADLPTRGREAEVAAMGFKEVKMASSL
jgi:hypothetical protein